MTGLAGLLTGMVRAMIPAFMGPFGVLYSLMVILGVIFLDQLVAIAVVLGGWLIMVIIRVGVFVIGFLVDRLPVELPVIPEVAWGTLLDQAGTLNRWLPLNEGLKLVQMWVGFYAAILTYKVVKLIRGGG